MPGATIRVVDRDDVRLAPYRDLTDADLRRAYEGRERIFVVEGQLAVRALLASSYGVRSMLVAESRLVAVADLVAMVTDRGADVLVAAPAVVAATVGFNLHRGVVALGERATPATPAAVLAAAARRPGAVLALIEGVNDHENLGALFRNAAAFGVAGVLLDRTCADPLYRRSVRVSLGHVLRVPWAHGASWPGDLDAVRAAGFDIIALTPSPGAADLADRPGTRPVAVLVGAEGPGLTAVTLAAVGEWIRIPMAEGVDSLNVATAAAVAFHHLTRSAPEVAE
jgi:tRNA G18 (ribose-2'-O)-methylase SpoU